MDVQARMPERFAPGKCDIWGASHQIFHMLVVAAAAAHLWGVWNAFEVNYMDGMC